MTWNTTNSKMINKMNNLNQVIQQHKPMILAIQEVNFTSNDDIADISIPGYNIELDQLLQTKGRARAALIIHESIRYSRRLDLETQEEAHLWITIQLKGNRKINLQCLYRQWRQLDTNGHGIPQTQTPASQKERMWNMSQKWKQALKERETISLSDTNINFNYIHLRPEQMDITDRKQIPLMKILQSQVFNDGAAYILTKSTRYNHLTKKYDFLDHLI